MKTKENLGKPQEANEDIVECCGQPMKTSKKQRKANENKGKQMKAQENQGKLRKAKGDKETYCGKPKEAKETIVQ